MQVENLVEAKSVKTQYNFSPLTITSDTIGNETLVEVSTPLATANIVIGDVVACKVSKVHRCVPTCCMLYCDRLCTKSPCL